MLEAGKFQAELTGFVVALDLEQSLANLGYEPSGIATDAAEALRLAEYAQPSLVLMDIGIRGGKDGILVAQEIWSR